MTARAPLAAVVAMARNRCIGREGALPWHVPEDLKHFKRLTVGHAIVMGRKTFESIGRVLPDRETIVVTRSASTFPGCRVAGSIDEAIAIARTLDTEPRIVGGAAIYEAAMPLLTTIHLTEIDQDVEGDVFFPALSGEWRETERRKGETAGVSFVTLKRV